MGQADAQLPKLKHPLSTPPSRSMKGSGVSRSSSRPSLSSPAAQADTRVRALSRRARTAPKRPSMTSNPWGLLVSFHSARHA